MRTWRVSPCVGLPEERHVGDVRALILVKNLQVVAGREFRLAAARIQTEQT
jgi:hypothetical protein